MTNQAICGWHQGGSYKCHQHLLTMPARRGRPPKSKKNSPIIDGAKFIKRFQSKLIYDQRGLLYQDLPIGCVRTLKGGRLYQEILREKNSQYYGGAEIIKIFFRGRTRRDGMVYKLDIR